MMSDVVIVSRDTFRNGYAPEGHVPYGTILDDEMTEADTHTFESMHVGAVPAVDWRGVDQVDTAIGEFVGKRGPGRPRKV
jgi:hypothetical protein